MDNETIKKSIAERFYNLQKEIQNILMSNEYEVSLVEIIKKYNLNENQMKEFELNTTLVLLGEIHPDKYKDNLKNDLNIDYSILENIVNEVENNIFKNVRDIILENWKNDDLQEKESLEIPLPPYADKIEETRNVIENTEKKEDVFEKTGIKMVEETPIPEPKNAIEEKFSLNEDKTLVESGISLVEENIINEKEHLLPNMETQKSVLGGIENPPSQNIINQKMSNAVISTQNASQVSNDPYRESI